MTPRFLNMLRVLPVLALSCFAASCARATTLPDPAMDAKLTAGTDQSIVFSGGCFWGIQAVFQHVKGVKTTLAGYAGGEASTAHYEMVSTGTTGHAESVKVTYDPSAITAGQLMKVFFSVALDPTELNYQGPDQGTQYRSAIWTTTPEQKEIARTYIAQLDAVKAFPDKIVTQVNDFKPFYPAEDYHQDFATKNPTHPYIMMYDAPKVAALKKDLPAFYK